MMTGANIDQQNEAGFTRLMIAARNGQLEKVQRLIEAKANTNIQNKRGFTALILAARENHSAIVGLLLDNRADATLTSNAGDTALNWACYLRNTAVIDEFLSRGYPIKIEANQPNVSNNGFFSYSANTDPTWLAQTFKSSVLPEEKTHRAGGKRSFSPTEELDEITQNCKRLNIGSKS